MNQKTKNFLLYGATQKIEKKQIVKIDLLLLIISILAIYIGEKYVVWEIFCALPPVICIPLTFSTQDVKGIKTFLIYGVWSVCFMLIFASFGIKLILSLIDRSCYFMFGISIILIYGLFMAMYAGLVFVLIKKDVYKKLKSVNGRLAFILTGISGITIAKICSDKSNYEKMIQIGSVCFFLLSFLSMLGCFNLIKYYYLKKNPSLLDGKQEK